LNNYTNILMRMYFCIHFSNCNNTCICIKLILCCHGYCVLCIYWSLTIICSVYWPSVVLTTNSSNIFWSSSYRSSTVLCAYFYCVLVWYHLLFRLIWRISVQCLFKQYSYKVAVSFIDSRNKITLCIYWSLTIICSVYSRMLFLYYTLVFNL
jgi:hypothetical protein